LAALTLLGHVAVEVLFGPEAAEEVLGQVQLGPLHACVGKKIIINESSMLAATYITSLAFKGTSFNQPQQRVYYSQ